MQTALSLVVLEISFFSSKYLSRMFPLLPPGTRINEVCGEIEEAKSFQVFTTHTFLVIIARLSAFVMDSVSSPARGTVQIHS